MLIMVAYSVAIYLFLARFLKIWSTNVQLHSIVHCVAASIITTYAMYDICDGNLFSFKVIFRHSFY